MKTFTFSIDVVKKHWAKDFMGIDMTNKEAIAVLDLLDDLLFDGGLLEELIEKVTGKTRKK